MAAPPQPSLNGNGNGKGHAPTEAEKEREEQSRRYWEEIEQRKLAGLTTAVETSAIGKPRMRPRDERPVGRAVLRRLSEVQSRDYDWLWTGRIPIGEPVIYFGDCDQGKSMLSIALASIVTRGGCWPDLPDRPTAPGDVLFIQDEDSVEATLKPRVDKAGGDPARIHALDHIAFEGGRTEDFCLSRHLGELEAGIARIPDLRLLVIDPVSAYLAGVDEHSNAEVRGVLKPLAKLSRKLNFAVVLITHVNKGAGVKANYRVMGSSAFVNAPRAAFLVATDPGDPGRRLIAPSKFNIGVKPSGLAYRFDGMAIRWESETIPGLTANGIFASERSMLFELGSEKKRGFASVKIRDAMQFILARIDKGDVRQNDLLKDAGEEGCSESTFRHAMKRLEEDGKVEFTTDEAHRKVVRKGKSLFLPASSDGEDRP